MAHIEIDRHTFFDVNNIPRILRGVSVPRVADLRLYYSIFWREYLKVDPTLETLDFKTACESEKILNTAIAIVELCGINPDWLDLDLLGALIHSYTDSLGEPQRGLVAQIHFKLERDPKSVMTGSESDTGITFDQYYIELLTTLASTEGSLIKAKETLEDPNLSQAEVEGYLATKAERIRKEQSDPKNLVDKIRRGKAKYIELKAKAEANKASVKDG